MTQHSEANRSAESAESIEPVQSVESAELRDSLEHPGSHRTGDSSEPGGFPSDAPDGLARHLGQSAPTDSFPALSTIAEHLSRAAAPESAAAEPTGPAEPGRAGRADPLGSVQPVVVFSHPARSAHPGRGGPQPPGAEGERDAPDAADHLAAMAAAQADQVVLRSPAELADALPYLLGYRPEDSIVLVAIHDRHGYGGFGGRVRLGIPARPEDWPEVARQLARSLVSGCERRGARPEGIVAFVCRDSPPGGTGRRVMEALRPLAQLLRTECGSLDIPVLEALCMSDGRYWSYCCPGVQCCPRDGTPMGLPGASVLSAAMTYAGLQVRGTLKEFRARLTPWETAAALDQESALHTAGAALVPRVLDETHRSEVAVETLDLGRRLLRRLAGAPRVQGALEADQRDDELIAHQEAAALILGLQDRNARDQAAEWMECDEAGAALRLWRALARRCVGPYGEFAAAPLTLVGWVAWSMGDEIEAREALAMALGADPEYLFARLLHQACNEGLDPESIRRCLRSARADRAALSSPEPTRSPGHGPKTFEVSDGRTRPAEDIRSVSRAEGGTTASNASRTAACLPRAGRTRRAESRGPGRGATQQRARPTRVRTAGTGLGMLRPPGRPTTGRR